MSKMVLTPGLGDEDEDSEEDFRQEDAMGKKHTINSFFLKNGNCFRLLSTVFQSCNDLYKDDIGTRGESNLVLSSYKFTTLTYFQTTNFRLVQIETDCRRQS